MTGSGFSTRKSRTLSSRLGRVALAGVLLGGLALGGCATRGYDDLETTNRSLENQNQRLQRELQEARASLSQRTSSMQSTDAAVAQQRQVISDLQTQLAQRNEALRNLEQTINQMDQTVLDPQTDAALARLASQNPGLVGYDPDLGMLRFSSDLTFGSGSADLRDSAKASLTKLASILKDAAGSRYVVEIVGHTDNEKISANTAKRFPTNTHLSVGRAISVRDQLASLGVPPASMRVSGWGEFHPLVPNNPTGGTAQNRRVEIYLTRGGFQSATVIEQGGAVDLDRTPPPDRRIDTTK